MLSSFLKQQKNMVEKENFIYDRNKKKLTQTFIHTKTRNKLNENVQDLQEENYKTLLMDINFKN